MRVLPDCIVGSDGASQPVKPSHRTQREKAVKLMMELVCDAFTHANIPPHLFPSLEVMKEKVIPQALRVLHELDW